MPPSGFGTMTPPLPTVRDAVTLEAVIGSPRAVLFKHSTRCPVSAYVIDEVTDFARTHPEWPVHVIEVIEQRALSDAAAERLGVRHESPQAFVLERGGVRWHGSHDEITAEALERETADAAHPSAAPVGQGGSRCQ